MKTGRKQICQRRISLNWLSCAWFISSDTETSRRRSQITTFAKQVCFSSLFRSDCFLLLSGWAVLISEPAVGELTEKRERKKMSDGQSVVVLTDKVQLACHIWKAHLLLHRTGSLTGRTWQTELLISYLLLANLWAYYFLAGLYVHLMHQFLSAPSETFERLCFNAGDTQIALVAHHIPRVLQPWP